MPSSQSPSADPADRAAGLSAAAGAANGNGEHIVRRRFVEAARRAEIVGLINAATDEDELGRTFAEELCEVFDAEIAFVADTGSDAGVARAIASVGTDAEEAAGMLTRPECIGPLASGRAAVIDGDDVLGVGLRSAVVAPFRAGERRTALVGVGRVYDSPFDEADRSLVEAVTLAVGQALERIWAFEARDRSATQQTAMVRAAKLMSRSLEIDEVMQTLCETSRAALGCDSAGASLGDESGGYVVVGASGMPDGYLGFRRAPGMGLGGAAMQAGRTLVTHAYQEEGHAPPEAPGLDRMRTCVAVPLRWNGRIRGFISAGNTTQRRITAADIELLEGFAELASLASANAERHHELRQAAELDGLTGCLNRDAFEDVLDRLLAASAREGSPLCLALLDLDGFKSINDVFGHLSGDVVLRKVGDALRSSVRADDVVARYGGDEFALILPASSEEEAGPLLDRVRTAIRSMEVPGGRLTACVGVAEHAAGEPVKELLSRADEALRDAKGSRGPGAISRASRNVTMASGHGASRAARASRAGDADRRQRHKALAGDIGLGITRELDPVSSGVIAAQALTDALALERCSVLRLVADGRLEELATAGSGAISEDWQAALRGPVSDALREKRTVVEAPDGFSELAAPLIIGGRAWGVVACAAAGRLDDMDAELVSAVADHLASALRAGDLYQQLTESMIGTAEALAAAMEAKDSYTADHARSIAELAVEVGSQMELPGSALEDLRYAGIFHDVGKIAVPDALLNKPGPLTEEEFEIVKEHPAAGAEILAPVPFLYGVRTIVRHAHEHWDGGGYPDGLRGPQIPLGARIVLAVDAYHAMTSDRPYRKRLTHERACDEIRDNAGTQFDPEVAEALLQVLARREREGTLEEIG